MTTLRPPRARKPRCEHYRKSISRIKRAKNKHEQKAILEASNLFLFDDCIGPQNPNENQEWVIEEVKNMVRGLVVDPPYHLANHGAEVIMRRYGIDCPQQTLGEIAEDLGLSQDRIRQIENNVLRLLRHPYRLGELKYLHKSDRDQPSQDNHQRYLIIGVIPPESPIPTETFNSLNLWPASNAESARIKEISETTLSKIIAGLRHLMIPN